MTKYIYIFKEILLIYPLTLWSQNVLIGNELSQKNNQFVSNILKLTRQVVYQKINVDVANTLFTITWRRDLWTIAYFSETA